MIWKIFNANWVGKIYNSGLASFIISVWNTGSIFWAIFDLAPALPQAFQTERALPSLFEEKIPRIFPKIATFRPVFGFQNSQILLSIAQLTGNSDFRQEVTQRKTVFFIIFGIFSVELRQLLCYFSQKNTKLPLWQRSKI